MRQLSKTGVVGWGLALACLVNASPVWGQIHRWSQRFGDTDSDGGAAIAVDGAGNVLVTGDTGEGRKTHPVAGKLPNPFGLFDMHGNVREWCRDHFGFYTLPVNPGDGERQPSGSSTRIFRGAGYSFFASFCRSAFRSGGTSGSRNSELGFRPVVPSP